MRILTVCASTNVFGAEIITLKLLEGFSRAGHEQLAVTSIWTDGEFNRRLSALGISEVRLPFGALSKRLALQPMWWTANVVGRLPWLWLGWRRVVRKFQPDVVIFTSWRLALPVAFSVTHLPAFLVEHSNLEPTKTRLVMYKFLARKLTGFVAVSNFTGRHLLQLGIAQEQIHVIRNGVFSDFDRGRMRCAVESRVAHAGPPRIGIVGQVRSSKGHDVLLEACRLLLARNVPVDIRVFGTGDPKYIASLNQKVARYGLSKYWTWMGYQADSSKIYSGLDICVMPSFNESFGMVAVEASGNELPIIASNCGGLPEIIEDGVTGLLVEPGDPNELAGKICWLLDNPEAARRFGIEGRKKVLREFTQEQMVAGYETLFRRSLDRS